MAESPTNMNMVDRVVERLKLSPVGDLITEDDLHEICKQAIQKTFFENRVIKDSSGYSSRDVINPPLIVEVMAEVLREQAAGLVKAFLAENAEMVMEHWKEVTDAGLLNYVQRINEDKATSMLRTGLNALVEQMNNDRAKAGLPYMSIKF